MGGGLENFFKIVFTFLISSQACDELCKGHRMAFDGGEAYKRGCRCFNNYPSLKDFISDSISIRPDFHQGKIIVQPIKQTDDEVYNLDQ